MATYTLFEAAGQLPRVTLESALQYRKYGERMLEMVNTDLIAKPNLTELIGHNPLEMMRANHQNHLRFMVTVFCLNAFPLMARIVVWVYRAYHAHGFSYEYFQHELRAWQRAAAGVLSPPAAAYEINHIYQWLIEHHHDFIALAESDEYLSFPDEQDRNEESQRFTKLLLQNDYRACLEMAAVSSHSAAELIRFYQQAIHPALVEVGLMWEKGEISVAQEHMATAIAMRVMAVVYSNFTLEEPTKGTAVITAAPNELHELGARIFADQLEMDGWRVEYYGANLPEADLLERLRKEPPFLLAISVIMPFNIEEVHQIITQIKADPVMEKVRVLVGGTAFLHASDLWRVIQADGCATDATAGVDLARGWWEESRGKM